MKVIKVIVPDNFMALSATILYGDISGLKYDLNINTRAINNTEDTINFCNESEVKHENKTN